MSTATKLAVEIINGNPAERILVIAPNYREFVYWCHQNDINHHAPNIRCVVGDQHIRGCHDALYVCIGFPDSIEGDHLREAFQYLKATRGLKNAEVIQGDGDAHA